jgi:hypothetical protein
MVLLFRGKNAHFAEFRVSRNSQFRGSERKGIESRKKIKFDGTANITTKNTFNISRASYQCKRHRKRRTKNNVFISHLCTCATEQTEY